MFKQKAMKKIILFGLVLVLAVQAQAQKEKKQKFISLAFTNSQTAMPFSKFSRLFMSDLHPGIEAGLGFNWKTKKKHDWFQEFRAGYFFHRFVQHGIPVYTNLGYRYKFSTRFSAEALLGGGYLHSIPATAKLKLDDNGEYKNNKGIGRVQGMVNFSVRASYLVNPSAKQPMRLFMQYQQQLQMPFVKSYVPLLPYNVLMIGVSRPIKSKK